MTYARQRQDLLKENLAIPYTVRNGGFGRDQIKHIQLKVWTKGRQDEGEEGEFHTALGVFSTIDLEFRS